MDYLSYPTLNKAEEVNLYCDVCEQESRMFLTLRMSADIDTKIYKTE